MPTYINIKNNGEVETVDEFETRKEAVLMVNEYQYSDLSNHYYLSQRSTNEWKEK
jgi:hypothetical protein